MQSSLIGRVVLGIAVVAAAAVLLVVLSDSDDGTGSTTNAGQATSELGNRPASEPGDRTAPMGEPAVPTIIIKDGKPVGGVEELVFSAGDRIRFAVRADAEDEVHLHGYDIAREVGPGRVAQFDFSASIEGVFEAELHGSGEQIAELTIEP